jgi:hypothetical protein
MKRTAVLCFSASLLAAATQAQAADVELICTGSHYPQFAGSFEYMGTPTPVTATASFVIASREATVTLEEPAALQTSFDGRFLIDLADQTSVVFRSHDPTGSHARSDAVFGSFSRSDWRGLVVSGHDLLDLTCTPAKHLF